MHRLTLFLLAVAFPALAADDAPTLAADQQAQYDEQYVWFEDYKLVNLNSGAQVGEGADVYQGKYKKKLDDGKFYDVVGRSDLAGQYRSTNTLKLSLLIGGTAVGLAAPLATLGLMSSVPDPVDPGHFEGTYPQYTISQCFGQPNEQACIDQADADHDAAVAEYQAGRDANLAARSKYIDDLGAASDKRMSYMPIMFAGLGVGAAAVLVSYFINPHPIELPERRRLADEHNQQLKKKLGVPATEEAPKPAEQPKEFVTELRLGGAVTPVGSAVTLSGRF